MLTLTLALTQVHKSLEVIENDAQARVGSHAYAIANPNRCSDLEGHVLGF